MSLLAKMDAAMSAKDEAAMNELFHDDYKFTMHSSGTVSYTHLTLPTKRIV